MHQLKRSSSFRDKSNRGPITSVEIVGCSPCARFLFLPTSLTTVFEVVLTPFFILRHVINPVGSTLETQPESDHFLPPPWLSSCPSHHRPSPAHMESAPGNAERHHLLSQKTRGKTRLRGKVLRPAVNVERVLSSSAVSLWWYQVGWRKPTSGMKRKCVC